MTTLWIVRVWDWMTYGPPIRRSVIPPRDSEANRALAALFAQAIDEQRDRLATTVSIYGGG